MERDLEPPLITKLRQATIPDVTHVYYSPPKMQGCVAIMYSRIDQ
jgi:hypothetical protein